MKAGTGDPMQQALQLLVNQTRSHPDYRTHFRPSVGRGGVNDNSYLAAEAVVALDCEMVMTEVDAMALGRVTCLDLQGRVLLDAIVRPSDTVLDWRTHMTGLNADLAASKGVTRRDACRAVRKLLGRDTILVRRC